MALFSENLCTFAPKMRNMKPIKAKYYLIPAFICFAAVVAIVYYYFSRLSRHSSKPPMSISIATIPPTRYMPSWSLWPKAAR